MEDSKKAGVANFIVFFETKQDLKDELLGLRPIFMLQYTSSAQLSPTIQIIKGII